MLWKLVSSVAVSATLTVFSIAVGPSAASAGDVPTGERTLGQSILEPVYNDEQAGVVGFVMTPVPAPMEANPSAWAPFYVPVYPTGSTVGTLQCQHTPADNCPDHGPGVAAAAQAIMPTVYGSGVLGHDHLMDFPGGADFNVAWEPILVLFTSPAAANEHLLTDDQIDAAVAKGDAIEVPVPQRTFHCQAVSQQAWNQGTPVTPIP
jgi:hypothetical protein